jgi:hypothetical protein
MNGVPPEARAGLDEVLARAVGVERARFDDEESAESLTWCVFSHLLQTQEAAGAWQLLLGQEGLLPWPSALLWGGEALGEQSEYAREELTAKVTGWAPDVLLEHWPEGLVMVTARSYRPAPFVEDRARWSAILDGNDAFGDRDGARKSGRIDLAQAWRIGHELAGTRRFVLVELLRMPERAAQRVTTDLFRASLRESSDRQFRQLSWRDLLAVLQPPWPEWLWRWSGARRLRPASIMIVP